MNNVDLVKEYIDVVLNQAKLDELDKYIDPRFEIHSLHYSPQPVGETQPGSYKEALKASNQVLTDSNRMVEDIFSENDKIVVRWTTEATHTGELMGVSPTNKRVKFSGVSVYRLVDGKIKDEWYVWDRQGLKEQLV